MMTQYQLLHELTNGLSAQKEKYINKNKWIKKTLILKQPYLQLENKR